MESAACSLALTEVTAIRTQPLDVLGEFPANNSQGIVLFPMSVSQIQQKPGNHGTSRVQKTTYVTRSARFNKKVRFKKKCSS